MSLKDDNKKLAKLKKLENFCKKWIKDMEIGCVETIYQTDRVVENSLEFIEGICNIVGYHKLDE